MQQKRPGIAQQAAVPDLLVSVTPPAGGGTLPTGFPALFPIIGCCQLTRRQQQFLANLYKNTGTAAPKPVTARQSRHDVALLYFFSRLCIFYPFAMVGSSLYKKGFDLFLGACGSIKTRYKYMCSKYTKVLTGYQVELQLELTMCMIIDT